ncbi:MAG: hypothetical protein A2749_00445 [Parcubacteria group bacterium RIFCSPHIGHO2_01_FULL_45_26]|nr:MAG: hypothetical protein A2749_00445 [Parcubacteria group bacterium RIFCSPHIGHO2_01_FULL_45_26]
MQKPVGKMGRHRASNELDIIERFEAGIELTGTEVRSLKEGRGVFAGARVIVRGGEAFVVGASIPAYQNANAPSAYDPDRTRRLLLSKKEIASIANLIDTRGATALPSHTYTKGNRIKVEVVVGRRKKKFDKRQDLRRKYDSRAIARAMKEDA